MFRQRQILGHVQSTALSNTVAVVVVDLRMYRDSIRIKMLREPLIDGTSLVQQNSVGDLASKVDHTFDNWMPRQWTYGVLSIFFAEQCVRNLVLRDFFSATGLVAKCPPPLFCLANSLDVMEFSHDRLFTDFEKKVGGQASGDIFDALKCPSTIV